MFSLWFFFLIVNVCPLSVGFDLLFILFRIDLWTSAVKELCPWLFTSVVYFSAVLVVRVPFPFGIWGRVFNLIVIWFLVIAFLSIKT